MTQVVNRDSQERLTLIVYADVDPTTFTVEHAFTVTQDGTKTFVAGSWKATPGEKLASGKWRGFTYTPVVGAGSVDLAPGEYWWWCRVVAGGEQPVLFADMVQVT